MQCNEEHEGGIFFNLVDKEAIPGSRGEANFILKCKFCDRVGNVEYIDNSIKVYDKNEQFQTIASFECRNLELIKFESSANWKATGTEGDGETEFDDIDLANEPDWAGFDEDGDCAVGIYDFKSQIVTGKKGKK